MTKLSSILFGALVYVVATLVIALVIKLLLALGWLALLLVPAAVGGYLGYCYHIGPTGPPQRPTKK